MSDPSAMLSSRDAIAVRFGSVLRLVELRDQAFAAIAEHVVERRRSLNAALGLSGVDGDDPTSSSSSSDELLEGGDVSGAMTTGGGRLSALRGSASHAAQMLGDMMRGFLSLESLVRQARQNEGSLSGSGSGRAASIRAERELESVRAELIERTAECQLLRERITHLKSAADGASTSRQAVSLDDHLITAQKQQAALTRKEEQITRLTQEVNTAREEAESMRQQLQHLQRSARLRADDVKPRIVRCERQIAQAGDALADIRLSLDLLAGMYQRACEMLRVGEDRLRGLEGERTQLAKKLHGEIKKVRILEGEVARMEAVNLRVMAAHGAMRRAIAETHSQSRGPGVAATSAASLPPSQQSMVVLERIRELTVDGLSSRGAERGALEAILREVDAALGLATAGSDYEDEDR